MPGDLTVDKVIFFFFIFLNESFLMVLSVLHQILCARSSGDKLRDRCCPQRAENLGQAGQELKWHQKWQWPELGARGKVAKRGPRDKPHLTGKRESGGSWGFDIRKLFRQTEKKGVSITFDLVFISLSKEKPREYPRTPSFPHFFSPSIASQPPAIQFHEK